MKQTIFNNWNFIRVLRLALGIAIIVQSLIFKDITMVLFGLFFTAMPIFNIGCCGSNACAIPDRKKDNNDI